MHLFTDSEHKVSGNPGGMHKIMHNPPVPAIEATEIMLELLSLNHSDVLMEIGTGTGTQTAIWQKHCAEVHSVELNPQYRVAENNYLGPHVYLSYGDGAKGLPDAAPFDAIVVTCGVPDIPEAWIEQLKQGGRLVAPVGTGECQKLTLFLKHDGDIKPQRIGAYVRFVMMERENGIQQTVQDYIPL